MSGEAFWSRYGRAGRNSKATRAAREAKTAPAMPSKYACRGCGAPGKRLCVCDAAFDRFSAMVRAQVQRGTVVP